MGFGPMLWPARLALGAYFLLENHFQRIYKFQHSPLIAVGLGSFTEPAWNTLQLPHSIYSAEVAGSKVAGPIRVSSGFVNGFHFGRPLVSLERTNVMQAVCQRTGDFLRSAGSSSGPKSPHA